MPQTNEEVEEEVVDEVELEEETPTAESPDGEEEVIAVENEADDAGAEMVEEPAAPDIDQLVADRVAAAIAPYQEVLGSLQANASRERGTLIAEILGADNCALTRNQLEKADTALLTNLAQTLRKPDYSGQGHFIPNTAVTNDLEPIEAPKLFDNE